MTNQHDKRKNQPTKRQHKSGFFNTPDRIWDDFRLATIPPANARRLQRRIGQTYVPNLRRFAPSLSPNACC
jgi:hypothetical protein